jgi:predicted nucleotidyltransferase
MWVMQLTRDQINSIISFLQSKMKLRLLIVYGSYASGHATEKSDIDLAFLADDEIDSFKLWYDISQELALLMHVESIDLVDMKTIDTVFRFIIVSTGQVIFQDGDFDVYLDLAYTQYLQLNDDRREILDNYGEMISGWRDGKIVLKRRYQGDE